MANPISNYLVDDLHAPTIPKPSLQQYDNYQIYSIVGIDYPHTHTFLNSVATRGGSSTGLLQYSIGYDMQATDFGSNSQPGTFTNFLAYQQYSVNPIDVDFKLLANKILAIQPKNTRKSIYISSINVLGSFSDPSPTPVDNTGFNQLQAIANQNNSTDINQFSYVYIQVGGGSYYELRQWIYTSTGTDHQQITLDCLLDGYGVKTKPSSPTITPSFDGIVNIQYYRINRSEPIPICRSIDWMSYAISIRKNVPISLPIIDVVFGTLLITGSDVVNIVDKLDNTCLSTEYKYSDFLFQNIDVVISEWISISDQYVETAVHPNRFYEDSKVYSTPVIRVLAANNNVWSNANIVNDLNYDANHPMFIVDNNRAYDWHVKPQPDGSYGDLIMNSPKLEEIHAALGAGVWGINPDDQFTPRIDNLGWRIKRLCDVFGVRVKTDGTIDKQSEKKLVRKVIDKKQDLGDKKPGITAFTDDGMILKRINNRFKKKEIVSDQCVIIQDVPQLIQEFMDQLNLSLGIQESSAIEIVEGDKVARFNNQLEILVELVHLLSSMNEMTRSNLVSSLVTQSQSNEIIGGLGLPSVTKTIPIKIGKSVSQLPFKGIAAHRSISQEIATCTYNVGLVTGQLL
jgi:hypothetical protein